MVTTSTTDPLIGRLIDGRYQVRSRIARGGMATVYLATDLRLERRVAVKVMHGHLADDTQFKQRFIQEARSAARLAHPNVVNVFDQGQDDDFAYLVMEYLPGITLRELLQDHGALTPEQTIDISEAVLSGLAAAHKAGIVHRDLKPENVLLADDGRIKIGDFGLARAASANTATGAALLGTIAYLSPELVTRGVADTRSDIYAVGIMMYEMLTGEQPYKGEQPMQIAYQHANDTVPAPSNANPQVPAELDELVLWATARDPEERPRDARVLLEQVHDTEALLTTALPTAATAIQKTMVLPTARQATAETQVLGARTASPPLEESTASLGTSPQKLSRVASSRRRRGWVVAVVVTLLALLAGGTGWWFGQGPGGYVTIPASVVEKTPEEARTLLEGLGIQVSDDVAQVTSLTVDKDLVVGTDPKVGTSIRRDAVVTIQVSIGPAEATLPSLAGVPLTDATQAIETAGMTLDENVVVQFSDSDKDLVLKATVDSIDVTGGSASLADGQQLFEGQMVSLVVSAGRIPDISGDSVELATQKLEEVGLRVATGSMNDWSEEISEGAVIGLAPYTEPLLLNAEVVLHVSDGPQPIPVPSIVGLTWSTAKAKLESAGLSYSYWGKTSETLGEAFPSKVVVVEIDPGTGTELFRGDSVKVRLEPN